MSYKKEIIGFLIVFIIVYVVIFLDKKINNYECDKCKNSSQSVSFKVPLLIAILILGIYKFAESYIHDYFNSYANCISRQDLGNSTKGGWPHTLFTDG
jgi:c-di-AMP phosphodiesterase-like protein